MKRSKAIDTHVHFWELESYRPYKGWFGDKSFLQRDYLPPDLLPELASCNVESAIIVGAAPDSDEHNRWCGELVEQHAHVSGLVGSYTFDNPQLDAALDYFAAKPWFVGIRAKPSSAPEQWTNDAIADRGVAELRRRNLVLDILTDHTLLPAVATFAAKHDDLPFVVNHCGLPPFRSGDLTVWAKHIRELAMRPNAFMKYSSFFLHCYPNCEGEQLQRAANVLFESFGTKRLLWGSNWPPELLGGTYATAYMTMLNYAGPLSDDEYNQVFRENAQRVYRLSMS